MLLNLLLFITQMGDLTYMRTQEDQNKLAFYEKHYEKFEEGDEIPQTLHFIWVGGSALPQDAKKNITAWAKIHPDWQINLWSDRPRKTPHPKVAVRLIEQNKFFTLSDNEGERAALAAYDILNQEGGVYLDCDTIPIKSLQTLNKTHAFYSGLTPLRDSQLSSSIQLSPHIIAAKKGHPILQATLKKIEKSWNPALFSGQSLDAIYYRTKFHTLLPFQEAVEENLGVHDRIYPAETFTTKYLMHRKQKLWLPDPDRFSKSVLQKLESQKKQMWWVLFFLVLFIIYGQKTILTRPDRKR
ncbi:MAG: hypothetical protein ChlgKO_05510 [Chlamydiales bacterium]